MTALQDLDSLLGHRHHPVQLNYGTAGFRGLANTLYEAVIRCGVLAACRSHALDGQAVGVMVTASHNPPSDNGLKIVEPDGSMLNAEWELLATRFVNASSQPSLVLNQVVSIAEVAKAAIATVVVGRDTRKTSPTFVDLVVQGVQAVGGRAVHVGLVTTPQLHFAVRARHRREPCMILHYYELMKKAYIQLCGRRAYFSASLAVDCANGVGAKAVKAIKPLLPSLMIVNQPEDGPLNFKCGSDFVQKNRRLPQIYTSGTFCADVWASLDGDADRLVMYSQDENGFRQADGDRFAVLVASFVSKHIASAYLPFLSIGVAQTAYSNGAATEFLKKLSGVSVVISKTGVKHLEKAVRSYDIGIYWEPNGHGTVLFKDSTIAKFESLRSSVTIDGGEEARLESISVLLAISRLANQAVGDGVADLLLICGILCCESMTFDSWLKQYQEHCSCNMVVHVEDKSVILTEDYDRVVKTPGELRKVISGITADPGCRAFVRPSGTENVVRVYAEAPFGCEEQANRTALVISQAVFDLCGGIRERP